jgi:hypothetical protein
VARKFNLKAEMRLISKKEFAAQKQQWIEKGAAATYEGSNYHKRYPEAWSLTRPNPPRPYTSKCEDLLLIQRHSGPDPELLIEIHKLIVEAFQKGTISAGIERGWPSCFWAVTSDGQIVEAHRGTRGAGKYHGYPFKSTKDFESEIRKRWKNL